MNQSAMTSPSHRLKDPKSWLRHHWGRIRFSLHKMNTNRMPAAPTLVIVWLVNLFAIGVLVLFPLTLIAKLIIIGMLLFFNTHHPTANSIQRAVFPIIAWLLLFTLAKHIPMDMRPPISTTVLPKLDTYIFGSNLVVEKISKHHSPFLDILAFIPYGIIHYISPVAIAIYLYIAGWRRVIPIFARCFGIMAVAAVYTQLIFPTTPPWYEINHGNETPNYSMSGNPGGLARIDDILHISLYGKAFGQNPLVFGAFPSLHSGFAVIIGLFLVHTKPMLALPVGIYIGWLWWSTMYLQHHYFVDLLGGAVYAYIGYRVGHSSLAKVSHSMHGKRRPVPTSAV